MTERGGELTACRQCGGRATVSFGDHADGTRLVWFESHRCDDCGLAFEIDDDGPLPEPLRSRVLAREGAWAVETAEGIAAAMIARALRGILPLDLREALERGRRPDRRVLVGTRAEALSLARALVLAGIDCRAAAIDLRSREP